MSSDLERELARVSTVLVRGLTGSKMGTAVLTSDRLLFFDEKFSKVGTEGILEDLVISALQKRHAAKGPLVDVPLTSITHLAMQKKFMARDRIAVTTTDGEFLLNEGWKELSPLLRDELTRHFGRRVSEDSPEEWRVEAN